MAALISCPKHNMVACLEKTERNAQFHKIFWNTATSKTVNDVSYIKAKVAGKTVSISEASIRRDLLFNDVDAIDCLTNQEIYENLQLMGYEGDLTILTFQKAFFSPPWKYLIHTLIHCLSSKSTSWDQSPINIASLLIFLATDRKFNFSKMIFEGMTRNLDAKKQFLMYPRFVQVFLNNQLSNLPAPLDNIPIPVLTKKVFTNMSKQGLHFSGRVTPLFPNMLAQAVVDVGEVPRDSLEGTDGSKGDQVQSSNDRPHSGGNTSERDESGLNLQAVEILKLKTRIKKLEKKCKPSISHHSAWLRSVSRLSRMKKLGKKESVSKHGRKNAKPGPTLDGFDDLDVDSAHGMDYMETEEAVNEGRQSNETKELNLDVDTEVIAEGKGSGEKGGSTVSTARPEVDTARPDTDTTRPEVHTANAPVNTIGVTISTVDLEVSAVEPRTPPITTSIFDDENITMAQTLIKMKEEKAKEKGVAFKDVEDSSRHIKRKDQGIDQIERDEELSHKLHEEELAEIARIQEEKSTQEEASRVAIMEMFDEVQAGIDVDALFAAKLQQEDREEYRIEERAKFLAETIVAQRKFKAAQRAAEIRSRPPTKSQLRNLMMTYLKNMGGYKHSQLKAKTFEEIQAMYERQKKIIDDFKSMDSDDAEKDSKKEAGEDTSKDEEVLKEPDSTRVEVKLEAAEQGTKKTPGKTVKMKARKKGRKQTHADTDVEHDFEEDERKTESMNKEDAVESTEKDTDASKNRKGGLRMKRQSKRKKTDSDLEVEEHLKTFLKIILDLDTIMSDSEHSTVTYTSVSFSVEDDSDIGSPGVDGPPIMPEDPYAYIMAAYEVPPSPDYIPGPEVPPSPDYIPGPEVPPSPDYIPGPEVPPSPDYIPGPEEPQSPPLLDFVPESDPEEDPADYPADRDDDDDENEDEDEDDEEEEHPAPVDSVPPVHRMTATIPSPPPNSPTYIEIPESCLPLQKRVRQLIAFPRLLWARNKGLEAIQCTTF
ncbi:hypothetical protein Tco_0040452 [Tanacetum coccineum]